MELGARFTVGCESNIPEPLTPILLWLGPDGNVFTTFNTLIFTSITDDQAGTYICQVTTNEVTFTDSVNIIVVCKLQCIVVVNGRYMLYQLYTVEGKLSP